MPNVVLRAVPVELSRGVLRSTVGVKDNPRTRVPGRDGHVQGLGDQVRAHVVGDGVADHLPGVQVNDRRQIGPPLPSLDIRNVPAPPPVGAPGGGAGTLRISRLGRGGPIWRRSLTCTPGRWSATPSPTTCART